MHPAAAGSLCTLMLLMPTHAPLEQGAGLAVLPGQAPHRAPAALAALAAHAAAALAVGCARGGEPQARWLHGAPLAGPPPQPAAARVSLSPSDPSAIMLPLSRASCAGVIGGQLSATMLVACEIAVECWMGLMWSPQVGGELRRRVLAGGVPACRPRWLRQWRQAGAGPVQPIHPRRPWSCGAPHPLPPGPQAQWLRESERAGRLQREIEQEMVGGWAGQGAALESAAWAARCRLSPARLPTRRRPPPPSSQPAPSRSASASSSSTGR